jgi:hypothetical protein
MLYMPMLPLPLSGPRRLNFTVREISGWYDRRRFVRFAARLYRGDRYWASGVISERARALDPKKNPALAHIRMGLFMAESRTLDEIVGAIAVWADDRGEATRSGPRAGSFGLFEVVNEEEVASGLLEAAETWVQEQLPGANRLRGPMELDPCRSPGLLVDGYNQRSAILMPYNPPYYPELIEAAGYAPGTEYLAYQLDLYALRDSPGAEAIRLKTEASIVQASHDLVVCDVNEESGCQSLQAALRSCDTTWRLGPESTEVTSADLAWRLNHIAASRHTATILVARTSTDGCAVAFGVAALNTREPVFARLGRRTAGGRWGRSLPGRQVASRAAGRAGIRFLPAVVRTDCRSWGLEGLILSELLARMAQQGHALAEVSPVPAADPAARARLAALGASPCKTYAIYEKRF